jgi:hypothetical protein
MNWKFDFSPETSDIFAAGGVVDVAAMEYCRSCADFEVVGAVAFSVFLAKF